MTIFYTALSLKRYLALLLLFSTSGQAQDFLQRSLKLPLRSSIQAEPPSGIAIALYDGERLIGSATSLCASDLPSTVEGRQWYVTAAHVIEGAADLRTPDGSVHVEGVASLQDVAFLSRPASSASAFCLPLPDELVLGSVGDAEAGLNLPRTPLHVEGVHRDSLSVRHWAFEGIFGSDSAGAMPGRDLTGRLASFVFGLARPGLSGGAIWGFTNDEGWVLDVRPRKKSDRVRIGIETAIPRQTQARLLGIVLAMDARGEVVSALPASRIKSILNSWPLPKSTLTARSVPGGVRYEPAGIIHYRSWIHEIGFGGVADGGIATRPSALPISGVMDDQGRRWLSVQGLADSMDGESDFGSWSEFEALPAWVLRSFTEKLLPPGIYEKEGALFSTSPGSLPFPGWASYFGSPMDFDAAPSSGFFPLGEEGTRCLQLEAIRHFGDDTKKPQREDVYSCSIGNQFWLGLKSEGVTFELSLEQGPGTTVPVPVTSSARIYRTRSALTSFESFKKFTRQSSRAEGKPLVMSGLRLARGEGYQLILQRFGGFRVSLQQGAWRIVGPMAQARYLAARFNRLK